jgi:hypothetical protein
MGLQEFIENAQRTRMGRPGKQVFRFKPEWWVE